MRYFEEKQHLLTVLQQRHWECFSGFPPLAQAAKVLARLTDLGLTFIDRAASA
jgi:hypothetical protein